MDSYKYKGKRKNLMDLLQQKGIEDDRVLSAINTVPRHLFMNSAFSEHAYEDKAFPIAAEQTISHPYTVAFQTSLLDLSAGDKVLEIGTGSGYQTAVLVAMGAEVYTIERQKNLVDFSRNILKQIKLEPKYQTYGDGFKGLPSFAPFDKIIVTAGAPKLPTLLVQQLKIGGIAVIPIGDTNQKMYTYLRTDERKYEQMEFGDYKFVPMLENKDNI